jgi:FkbM family methyltransferase
MKFCIDQIVFNVEYQIYGGGVYDPTGPVLLGSFFSNDEKQQFCLKRSKDEPYNGVKFNDRFILHEYDGYRDDRQVSVIDYNTSWVNRTVYKNVTGYATYNTNYGSITLYDNEVYIGKSFKNNIYWNEDVLLKLKNCIDPKKNILEVGGHCGASTIVLSSFLEKDNKVYVYEPQQNLYNVLVKNIEQNNLQNKIIPYNSAIFCYDGVGAMNNIDMDGGGGLVTKRYNEEKHLPCNFGGLTLGKDGETVKFKTLDMLTNTYDNIGLLYCSTQGSESFIFSKAIKLITKHRPIIFFVNNKLYHRYQFDKVLEHYPFFKEEGEFDIVGYCLNNLNYRKNTDLLNDGKYILLLPN